jgi:hypothetical protein
MIAMFKKPETVRGVAVPRRRFTAWAAVYFVLFVALPLLALGFGLDTLVYLLIDRPVGTCIAVLCWAG